MSARSRLSLTGAALLAGALCAPATAEEATDYLVEQPVLRMALVIGNQNYLNPGVETVLNASNDAIEVAQRLASVGFDTVVREDLDSVEMFQELQHLESEVHRLHEERGVRPFVAVYYSGHGFNSRGRGFLTGSEVNPKDPVQGSLAIETVLVNLARESVAVLFVDACRADVPRPSPPDGAELDGAPQGLDAEQEPKEPQEKWKGLGLKSLSDDGPPALESAYDPGLRKWKAVVWYAALRLGGLAAMGVSREDTLSPFTAAFLDVVGTRGLELSQEYGRVSTKLMNLTGGRQEPDQEGHVGYVFMLWLDDKHDELRAQWRRTLERADSDEIFAFLDEYPESRFTSAATKWLSDHGRAPP